MLGTDLEEGGCNPCSIVCQTHIFDNLAELFPWGFKISKVQRIPVYKSKLSYRITKLMYFFFFR